MHKPAQTDADGGVLTIMFTDVEGSTALATRVGDDAAQAIIETERRIVREQVAAQGGREIDSIGDGFMITFASTRSAVTCALAIQEALTKHGQEHPVASVRVRIGLNVGEVLQGNGHPFGAAVNAAARIAASAEGGEILVADAVRQLAGQMPGVAFRDRGRVRLKGFREHWHLYREVVVTSPPSAERRLRSRKRGSLPIPTRHVLRRKRVVVLGVALLLVGGIAAALAVLTRGRGPQLVSVVPNSVAALDARTNRILGTVDVGLRPISVASGAGSLWIANFGDRTVSRVDPLARRIVSTVSVNGTPAGIAEGEGAVWAANEFEGTVSRIDPETGGVVRSIAVGRGPRAVAVGEGSVWVANHVDGTLSRIDPGTNEVVRTFAVGAGPTGVAVGAGGIWVANSLERSVSRIDPASNLVRVRRIALRFHPHALAVDDDRVWVTGPLADAVAWIDPARNSVAGTIPVGDGPVGVAAANGAVFIAEMGGTVARIDPRRSVVVDRIRVGGIPESLALQDGLVWIGISGPRGEPPQQAAGAPRRGGTLRLAAIVDALGGLDPQREFVSVSWAHELFRCCLLRTLFSYTGRPTNKGGALPRPDLAIAQPHVSADGRTWTFRLKAGLHYAPPLARTAIKSQDVIRALERTAKVGGLAAYFSVIEGFDDFRRGRADSISGLEAPTGRTLIVHLKRPSGDLAARFALATTAPIPPGATRNLPYDDYGRFLVASGPYMFEGSEAPKSSPPAKRRPLTGHRPGRGVVLVRNPSWRRGSDPLRPAYADRIEITIGRSMREAERRIDEGRLDFVLDWNSSPAHLARYLGDPQARKRVLRNSADIVSFMSMNLAIPPLDDVHVRKAVNLVIDKRAWQRLVHEGFSEVFGHSRGDIAGHLVLDSLEDNLLVAYDPYAAPGRHGNLAAARAEMARSRYDRDGDGVCEARACRRLRAVTSSAEGRGLPLTRLVRRNLAGIGLGFADVESLPEVAMFRKLADPREKVAMGLAMGWAKDFPNGSSFIPPLFSRSSLGGAPQTRVPPNASLVGARPDQLRRWGYSVTSVPNLEAKIDQCLPLVGAAQAQCWAEADQFLMEKIVPVVPGVFFEAVRTVSARVATMSFAQSTAFPALDRIALR